MFRLVAMQLPFGAADGAQVFKYHKDLKVPVLSASPLPSALNAYIAIEVLHAAL